MALFELFRHVRRRLRSANREPFPLWRARSAELEPGTEFTPVVEPPLLPHIHATATRRLVDRVERQRYAAARPPAYGDRVQTRRVEGELREVVSAPGRSAADAAKANRDLVARICSEAHLDYFEVPEPNARRHRIGVVEGDWDTFVNAASRIAAVEPVYASQRARTPAGAGTSQVDLLIRPLVQYAAHTQRRVELFRFYAPLTLAGPELAGPVFGAAEACLVERWSEESDGTLLAPSANRRTTSISGAYRHPVELSERATTVDVAVEPAARLKIRTLAAFARPDIFDVTFPIDIVYTWVDGGDPVWQDKKSRTLTGTGIETHPGAAAVRFADNGELRYSMRSVEQFAPWARNIYLVTDDQVPSWLDPAQTRITLVDHRDIFPADALPTYNSHSIGARLHHIDGLSEHYLHFNDDSFLGRPVEPSTFFDSNGVSYFFLSRTGTLAFQGRGEALLLEQARRNVVELLERDFGLRANRVFQHTPIAQQKAVFLELEERYPEAMERTWRSRVRDRSDFEPNSWLHHYYGYLRGYTRPNSLRYRYIELGNPRSEEAMAELLEARDADTFCINEAAEQVLATDYHRVDHWLQQYFPTPASFERR